MQGIRSLAPRLRIGVRLSAFDSVPFRLGPAGASTGKPAQGVPEMPEGMLPYRWGSA